MTNCESWIEAYVSGSELEWSYDKIHWFPLTCEPVLGDGKYYREKESVPHETFYTFGISE